MTSTGRRLLTAFLLAAAALAAGIFWLLGTAGGARFLIEAASRRAPVRIEVGRVSGRLAGDLRLGSVGVRWPAGEASAESIAIRWRPWSLLEGTVSVAALSLEGVAVNLRPEEEAESAIPSPGLRWPSVTGLPARLEGSIDSLRLSNLSLRRPGAEPIVIAETAARVVWRNGLLSVSGLSVRGPGGRVAGSLSAGFVQPSLKADMEFSGVDLSRAAGAGRTDLSGSLRGDGSPQAYAGSFSLRNRGEGAWDFRLSGEFAGDLRGIALPHVEGNWLDGTLKGAGEASWKEGIEAAVSLEGRALNPARIRPDWPGRIRFRMKGSVKRIGESPAVAEVEGRLLSSTLRHRPLTGEVRARLDAEGFRIARLALHGDGFDVTAEGRLRDRLAVSADIRRVGGLLPGAEGSAKADGWIRWSDGSLEGVLAAEARRLRVAAIRLGSFSLSARHEKRDGPFSIEARGRDASKGALRIDSFTLDAAGIPAEHNGRLFLRSGSGSAEIAARGGYRMERWEGTVTGLSIEAKEAGSWTLAAPFPLAASRREVKVSPFRLAGPGGGSAGGSADLALGPLRGTLRAAWNRLDPGLANPWIADARLSGSSSGEARIRLTRAGLASIAVRTAASGNLLLGEKEIRIRSVEADLQWDGEGLSSRWEADLAGRGTLRGAVSSGEPAHPGIPSRGKARAEWKDLDLSLFSAWLPGTRIAGSSGGSIAAIWRQGGGLEVSGNADLSGTAARGQLRLEVTRARAGLEGNERGIRASLDASLGGGGTVTGVLRSDRPATIGIPDRGKIDLSFGSVDLAPASLFLPKGVSAEGFLAGRAAGEWLPGGAFALEGDAGIASGRLRWETKRGEAAASLRSADLRFAWKGGEASGGIALALEEHGSIRGTFRLPVPARFPPAMRADGAVEASLTAKFLEKGLLSAFFPAILQESTGEIDLSVGVGGTWGSPAVKAEATLSRAGAHLPSAGIRLEEVKLRAHLAGQEVRVETLEIRSGGGNLSGSATVHLKEWRIERYEGSLKGKDFLALDLTEVRLLASPDLAFEGTMRRLKVRGEVQVPRMQIHGRQKPPPVPRSEDVILVDAKAPSREAPPLSLDVSVKVALGKHVLVKAQGVDARLEGGFTLLTDNKGRAIARGEIRVAEGSYAVYGIRLKITRGSLLFAGIPVERPTLDFLAIREVGEVKAGVEVAGTLERPIVKLYSEPAMEDTDILSYIVLGHPLGQQKEQVEPLMLAAGALLPFGQSAMLQDRLKRRLGFDVLEVKTEGGETESSVVTIGKYLNPRLYVSYGRSIFTGAEEFTFRYDFWKRFQIESQIGEESGVDLFYKIEFR